MQYSTLGGILLKEDFNARMQNRQCDTCGSEDPKMIHLIESTRNMQELTQLTQDQKTQDMENILEVGLDTG